MKRLIDPILFVAAALTAPLYIAYLKTIRLQIVNEQLTPEHRLAPDNAIYVFWHSQSFLVLAQYRGRGVGVLTLLDWKNRFYDRLCRIFGYQTVQVTSQQRATLKLVRLLENGCPIAIAADGPHGPRGEIKPGAVYLGRKTGKAVIPVRVEAEKSFRLWWRWDQYEIPAPFTRATIYFNEPADSESKIKEALGSL